MPYYRKIPVVIEALQYDGTNTADVLAWSMAGEAIMAGDDLVIRTLEGDMKASPGDYIICGVESEYYPCKPGVFEATYELVEDVYEILEVMESRRISDESLNESMFDG